MKNNAFILGTLLLVSVAAFADGTAQQQPTRQEPDETNVSSTEYQQNLRTNTGEMLLNVSQVVTFFTSGGLVAVGIMLAVGLAAIAASIVSPHLCSTFGICGNEPVQQYYAYSARAGTFNAPGFKKRSLEYVGPILKGLSNAYDKYASQISAPGKKE